MLHGQLKDHFVFRMLRDPVEALDGKCGGHKEMMQNPSLLGLRKGDNFVSDKWRDALCAVKPYRKGHPLTYSKLRHEVVHRSAGNWSTKMASVPMQSSARGRYKKDGSGKKRLASCRHTRID